MNLEQIETAIINMTEFEKLEHIKSEDVNILIAGFGDIDVVKYWKAHEAEIYIDCDITCGKRIMIKKWHAFKGWLKKELKAEAYMEEKKYVEPSFEVIKTEGVLEFSMQCIVKHPREEVAQDVTWNCQQFICKKEDAVKCWAEAERTGMFEIKKLLGDNIDV